MQCRRSDAGLLLLLHVPLRLPDPFHGPKFRNGSDQGKAGQDKFKAVLQSMHGIKHKPCILPDSVIKLCAFIDMPELAAGAPCEPDAQALVQPPHKRRRQ